MFSRHELIIWMYKNQSQQQRKHLRNILFLIIYDNNGAHWKLKSEILWLKNIVLQYLESFDENKLKKFEFVKGTETLSDTIWAIKK